MVRLWLENGNKKSVQKLGDALWFVEQIKEIGIYRVVVPQGEGSVWKLVRNAHFWPLPSLAESETLGVGLRKL